MLRPASRLRSGRDERGAAAVISVLIALVLMTFAALAVDLGNGLARKGDTQVQADFAALAGAPELPGTKSASDPTVLAAADYLVRNAPQDDRPDADAWPTSTPVMANNLVDGSADNGEVNFLTGDKLQVISPPAQVNFGFAGIFRMFGADVTNHIDVAGDATVQVGTPDGLGVLPMYVASPTPGNPACDYGLQTLTDPPGGHVVPPTVPTLYLDSDTNDNDLDGISVSDGGAPASTIPMHSTVGQISLTGDFKDATRVGFFRSDDPAIPAVYVQKSDPEWVSPASTPYTQNNGSIVVNVPATVTAEDRLWYVRVYQAGTKNKWSARAEAQPLSVGDAPFECVGGSSSGNFGTLKMPRSTSNNSTGTGWIARNIALGLEPPLSLALMPGTPPPWQCAAATPGAVISDASNRRPGTNCLDTDTGMTSNTATPGFVAGVSGLYKGLLDTGSSSADPDGSGGCARDGSTNTAAVSGSGRSLNDDLLTCFMIDTTTEIGDVARRNYAGPVRFYPEIYQSPRFAWVPVFKQETISGGSNRYSIVDFRAAFIADQPMTATKANNAYNTGTSNGLGVTGSGGGFKVQTLKVIFLSTDALPDGQANTPIGPSFGPGFPQVLRLVD